MAEAVVCCVVQPLVSAVVDKLFPLLISEFKLLHGVSARVAILKSILEKMKNFLEDEEARPDRKSFFGHLVAEIRNLIYETEDVLECYAEVKSRRGSRIMKRKDLRRVVKEMEALQSKINNIKIVDYMFFMILLSGTNPQAAGSSTEQRPSHPEQDFAEQDFVGQDFVGMEEDIEILVSSLLDRDEPHVRVVSVWGTGGLGKTTLALEVYNHHEVRRWFNAFALVFVTQKHKTEEILKDVLTGLSPEKKDEITRMTREQVIEDLSEVQKKKKCLVVLDDIWSTDAWDSMRNAFPAGNCSGSKILFTTRSLDVAKHVDSGGFHHQLQLLNGQQRWELFKKKVFTENDSSDNGILRKKKKLGRKMVQQCKGLPLAIAVLGGLLRGKDLKYWNMVNMHVSEGSGIEMQHGKLSQVLALSYNGLPHQLKPCFLCLGCFPEGSEIEVEKLYQMWIAERFVLPTREKKMMDVAKDYLDKLATRRMVQILSVKVPAIRRYQLHDLMTHLCLEKAGKENFLHLTNYLNENQNESVQLFHSVDFLARLVIHLTRENVDRFVALPNERTLHLRTLLLHLSEDCTDNIPEITAKFCKFRMLRVLAMDVAMEVFSENCRTLEFPEAISKLVLLKYFSLGGNWREFPSSIGKLQRLQTLNLETCYFFYAPREDILKNMGQLRHLYLPQIYNRRLSKGKLRFDGLSNLETLVGFNTYWCEVKDLIKLTNLRELGAAVEIDFDHLAEITEYVNSSNNLKLGLTILGINIGSERGRSDLVGQLLRSASLYSLKTEHGKLKLPEPVGNQSWSPSLVNIDLSFTELEEGSIAVLERFPKLRILTLRGDSYVEEMMVCSTAGFPELRRLWLETSRLNNWVIQGGAMPNLSELTIHGCGRLEMLPDGLEFITCLQVLSIFKMPDEFKRRVKVVDGRGGEDLHKIRNVQTIKF